MKTTTMLNKMLFSEMREYANKASLKELHTMASELEATAKRAAMMAAYLEQRYGDGCGDQGHESALKEMNRAGRKVWVGIFGYNVFYDVSF